MVPPTPTPSARLLRAVVAEREELGRHRDRLLAAREQLRAELAAIEQSLEEIDERGNLLDRLTGGGGLDRVAADEAGGDAARGGGVTPARGPRDAATRERAGRTRAAGGAAADEASPPDMRSSRGGEGGERGRRTRRIDVGEASRALRGPAIRRAAVEVLLAQRDRPEALHYREWFELVRDAGLEVAGKDPLAVFLTQLSRSPVIRKGTQAGIYELDVAAPARLRIRLDRLHEELRRLTARPEATADLAVIRAQREQLTLEIGQTEKALEEAEAALAAGRGSTAVAAAS